MRSGRSRSHRVTLGHTALVMRYVFEFCAALLVAIVAASCSQHAAETGSGAGGDASAASSTSTVSSGSSMATCSPPCPMGEFCSVTGACIADGSCGGDGDCKTPGTICDQAMHVCVPGGCASEEIPLMPVAPNLLITLDRSCSMNKPPVGAMGPTKWQIASMAIDALTAKFKGQIRFGITLFPERFTVPANDCLQTAAIPVQVGPNNESAIQMVLADPTYAPGNPCVTNIDTAMAQASMDPGLMDMTRSDYVVLVTDGAQSASCGGSGADPKTIASITALAQQGVHTFVIGFGGAVDAPALTSFADAGLEVNPKAPPDYYDASDQASLDAAFQAIASKTLGCVFKLDKTPADPNLIYAFFDGMGVPRDPTHMNGWDYDMATNEITFYGMACADLKAGKVMKIQIAYGCDMPPPH